MATGIVPYDKKYRIYTAMCEKCGCMYIPEKDKDILYPDKTIAYLEPCPECGYKFNGKSSIIPTWKYKLIRAYRALRRTSHKPPDSSDDNLCLINATDFPDVFKTYYWNELSNRINSHINGKIEPMIIVRGDKRAFKRGEVVKRSPNH